MSGNGGTAPPISAHCSCTPSVNPSTDVFHDQRVRTDHYTDYAFDAGYQFLGDGTHIATVQGIYTHENQSLNGSAAMNGIAGTTTIWTRSA